MTKKKSLEGKRRKLAKEALQQRDDDGIIGNLRMFRVPNIGKSLSSFLFIFKRVTWY